MRNKTAYLSVCGTVTLLGLAAVPSVFAQTSPAAASGTVPSATTSDPSDQNFIMRMSWGGKANDSSNLPQADTSTTEGKEKFAELTRKQHSTYRDCINELVQKLSTSSELVKRKDALLGVDPVKKVTMNVRLYPAGATSPLIEFRFECKDGTPEGFCPADYSIAFNLCEDFSSTLSRFTYVDDHLAKASKLYQEHLKVNEENQKLKKTLQDSFGSIQKSPGNDERAKVNGNKKGPAPVRGIVPSTDTDDATASGKRAIPGS